MRLALLDPTVALSLDAARLHDVFRARGAKPPFAKGAARIDAARALFSSEVDDAVGEDLDDVERFGDGRGARALVEAALAVGRDVRKWPLAAPPIELAARLVAAREGSPPLLRVFRRARIRLDRSLAKVPSYDLLSPAPRAPVPAKSREARLRAALSRLFRADLFAVFACEDDRTGEIFAAAVLSAAPRGRAVLDAKGRLASETTRRLRSLLFSYDPESARLSVRTRAPERLFEVAAAFGEALFDDAACFSERPSLTLKPLSLTGEEGVLRAAVPDGVLRARLVGVQCDTLEDARVESRGPAAWGAIERHVRAGGYVTRVTLRLDVRGEERPIDVFVQLPYRFDVSEKRARRLARKTLRALGWTDPGMLADDAWTLAPFSHPWWRWVEALGGEDKVIALVAAKLLVKRRGARVSSVTHRRLGASYVTFEVPGEPGVRYALSEDLTAAARDVRDEELALWELDRPALEEKMRQDLGAQRAKAVPGLAEAGVLDLGVVSLDGVTLHFFYAIRAGEKGLAARIVSACAKGAVPIVLVPSGRRLGEGLRHVELTIEEQLGAAPIGHLLGRIAEEMELDRGALHPLQIAGSAVDVVVERKKQRVWIRGTEMGALAERSYRMIEYLASRPGEIVPILELAEKIAGKRAYLENVVRRTRTDVIARVRESFAAAKLPVPEGVLDGLVAKVGARGYRMELRVLVL